MVCAFLLHMFMFHIMVFSSKRKRKEVKDEQERNTQRQVERNRD